ncbi:MAG: Permease [Clostridia bacterium]|jgi:AGZA family xanthine/uracil permease-like MFS transporter|nr:Permease [Clostridia bacterium]
MNFFKLKENNTTVRTEVIAGITTFMTMAYILAVNPDILSATGMDKGALFTATAVSAAIGTLCMAFFANYPFALAPGMGLNAFFAFTVVLGMGLSWEVALTAVFVEGLIFILMSLFNVREAIFDAIPTNLKHAVGAGIGLFIAFIGFQNANIVIADSATKVAMFDINKMNMLFEGAQYNFNNVGITVVLTIIGVLVTGILIAKNIKGSVLWGILITYGLGLICEFAGLYVPYIEGGLYSLIPNFSNGIAIPSIAPILFKFDFSQILSPQFFTIVFAFLFVDVFDTLGTLIGVSSKAGFLDKQGKLPKVKGALLADAVATTVGAALGTSTVTTYVESASGVSEGGKTGLTAVVVAVLFALSLLLSPIFLAIPSFATAPALIIVGFYMIGSVNKINFNEASEGVPAFLAIAGMAFTYSISDGIVFGVVSYVVINLITANFKKLNFMLVVVAILFLGKFFAEAIFVQFTVAVIVIAIIVYYVGFKNKKK